MSKWLLLWPWRVVVFGAVAALVAEDEDKDSRSARCLKDCAGIGV